MVVTFWKTFNNVLVCVMCVKSYYIERTCSADEVLHHFLETESKKPNANHFQELLQQIKSLPGDQSRRRVREFAEKTKNGSPIFPWTVGINTDERWKTVQRWIYADVTLEQLYTCGINPNTMRDDLNKARGNLKTFTKCFARNHGEFRLDQIPPEHLRMIFGVARREDNKDGSIELIDGAHRTVSMLHNGITKSKGFVAEI